MLTCSIDIKNRDIVALWLYYCKTYTADVALHFPALMMCTDAGLVRYETFYKMLDLYYQFSTRLGEKYRRRPAGAGAGKDRRDDNALSGEE